MKILYFDCAMGAAGDMLAGSLLELFPDREKVLGELNNLGIPGVEFIAERSCKCGITGTHLRVLISGEEESEHCHHHTGMAEIAHIAEHLLVSPKVRAQLLGVYDAIAQAESQVHGKPVEQVHFHEVGAMDAIADITAVCYLLEKLQAEKIYASPVHVGSGQVKCAHGILPVPAPATALLLEGIPIYGGEIKGELCTPTGAALLRYFVAEFGAMPPMAVEKIGYGMGKKDFSAPNCVRAMVGMATGSKNDALELSCNLDDMTGEEIGFATEALLNAGALDVYTTPIFMKKNRPGIQLSVLCRPEEQEQFIKLMFRHTTTLGIREQVFRRYTLTRRTETVQTPYGAARKKCAEGYGVTKEKYEYEDLARLAREQDIPLKDVIK